MNWQTFLIYELIATIVTFFIGYTIGYYVGKGTERIKNKEVQND